MRCGHTEIVNRLSAVMLLSIVLACGGNKPGESTPGGTIAALLPSADLPDETVAAGQTQVYKGRELYDYIDGGADLYLEFGFVEAAVREYKSPSGEDITASIYRMEDPRAAFGIFSVTRHGASDPANMGSIGARSEFDYIFCHGDYFVQVQSAAEDSLTARAIEDICAKIDSELEGQSKDWPAALALLPRRGFVPHSEVYVEGPLGLNSRRFISDENLLELSDSVPGAMASYMVRQGGHPALYLVVEYPDSAMAKTVFNKLEEYYTATADQDRQQDANVQFKTGDNRIIYSNARKMDALVLQGSHLTGMFENIVAGHGANPHGSGSGIVNPHGGMPGGMMNPHGGGASGGMTNPHGGSQTN